jgi:hypothetical protein
MNYERIYNNLCNLCKNKTVIERISDRNKNDYRLNEDYVYTEKHHIIPRHAGGNDDPENIVVMLPEEHYMAHLLRYKAYKDRNDFLAIRFMINGYIYKKKLNDKISLKLKNKLVASFKQNIAMFRKENTWHTEEGIKNISESRKGTMPVKDVDTDEIIGCVSVNHPNVISGKWVHHTKGKLSVIDKNTKNKKYITLKEFNKNRGKYSPNIGNQKGNNNSRYCGFTDEDIINLVIDFSEQIDMGCLFTYSTVSKYLRKYKKYNKLPKSFSKFRFNGGGRTELHKIASERSGLKINYYFFNKPERKNKFLKNIKNIKIC